MSSLSIKIGDLLYKTAFPIYNFIYPIFKNRQDKREISILKEHIRPGNHVLDIGANIGFYSNILSELVGREGHVHCFEPDRLNFKRLEKNCGRLPNVSLYNKAVSEETGIIKIYKSTLLNVDHRTYPIDEYESVEEIPCVSLDEFLPANERIDFVKIDIQGFETSAFRGMKRILTENPNVKIVSEFWPFGLKKSGNSVEGLLRFFWDLGFQVSIIHESSLELLQPNDISRFDGMAESIYMNIFVTRK